MRPSKICLSHLFVCLSFVATFAPAASAQSTTSQSKAAIVAPPTAPKQWTGDMDVMLQHRGIRIGVPYSKTFYYTINGVQHGTAYEVGKAFEDFLNKKYPQKNKNIKVHVFFFVTPREKALTSLTGGFTDVLIGGIAITPERQKLADFSEPVASGINEIVVTGPNSPQLASLDDLAGKEVFVRKTSSYWEHLERLNERFKQEKKPAVILRAVPEDLNDEDILEMVNAGLLPTTVAGDWVVKLWGKLLTKVQAHPDMAIATGETVGWVVRKNSPKLLADVNEFLKTHRQGTAYGQQLITKYTGSTYMLKQAVSETAMKQFEQTSQTFQKYSAEYGMDYLLMMAEGFQESGLKQEAKSPVGAVGVMQLMPDTGRQMNVGDIHQEDANIHAGIKYFHSMVEKNYGNEPGMDDLNKILFTFAAYNCGPGRMKQLRAEAAAKGYNPNIWIDNVEIVAAERIGAETVNYVANIYKYYVAYKLIAVQEDQHRKAKESIQQKSTTKG
jgi:membrane-bound lytic murein transglycosylase MltF